MIFDGETGLTWRRHLSGMSMNGGEYVEHLCVEHPRLRMITQRANRDADYITTYTVDGISAQHYHSAREALAAAKANP